MAKAAGPAASRAPVRCVGAPWMAPPSLATPARLHLPCALGGRQEGIGVGNDLSIDKAALAVGVQDPRRGDHRGG